MLRMFLAIGAIAVALEALSGKGMPSRVLAHNHEAVFGGSQDIRATDAYIIVFDTFHDAGYPIPDADKITRYVLYRAVGHQVPPPLLDHLDRSGWPEILSPSSSGAALLMDRLLLHKIMPHEEVNLTVHAMLREVSLSTDGTLYREEDMFATTKCEARNLKGRFCDENGEIQTGRFLVSRGMLEQIEHACVEKTDQTCPGPGIQWRWYRLKASDDCAAFPPGSPVDFEKAQWLQYVDCDDPNLLSYSCFEGMSPGDIDCDEFEFECCPRGGCDGLCASDGPGHTE